MSMAEAIPEAEFFGDTAPSATKPIEGGRRGRRRRLVLKLVAWGVLFYLFVPLFVIILFSFNEPVGKFNLTWHGFSLEAWQDPFKYPQLTDALKVSLQVAAISTVIAVVLGTFVAIALVRQRFRGSEGVNLFLVIPLTAPEVVLGSSLLTLFLAWDWSTGFTTIIIAHVMFQISFVALTVKARVRGFDWTLEDAALDLGATPHPHVLPGDAPAHRPRHRGRRHVVVRALARRLHHHVLQQRLDDHLPAVREQRGEGRAPTADRRAGDHDPGDQRGAARPGEHWCGASKSTDRRRPVAPTTYTAPRISNGDRVTVAIPPVKVQQCDRSAIAEEVGATSSWRRVTRRRFSGRHRSVDSRPGSRTSCPSACRRNGSQPGRGPRSAPARCMDQPDGQRVDCAGER